MELKGDSLIVIVDNYDSFVYNILEYVSMFTRGKIVSRERAKDVPKMSPDGVIISPGPGKPDRELAFIFEYCIDECIPLLGICLGHQMIAEIFGGRVGKVKPLHGKSSTVTHDGMGIFRGIRNPIRVGRYHSLAVLDIPDGFRVTAVSEDGVIMGMRRGLLEGVQFHPESVLTESGVKMIRNFVMTALEDRIAEKIGGKIDR